MARINQFSDPGLQLERRQFLEIGCGGCQAHQIDYKKNEFDCSEKQEGYPYATNKSCPLWRRRRPNNGES